MIGVLTFAGAFSVSAAVAAAQNGTAYPMTTAIINAGAAAALLWFGALALDVRSRSMRARRAV